MDFNNSGRPGRSVHRSVSVRLNRLFGLSVHRAQVPIGIFYNEEWFRFGINRFRIGAVEVNKIHYQPITLRFRCGFGFNNHSQSKITKQTEIYQT